MQIQTSFNHQPFERFLCLMEKFLIFQQKSIHIIGTSVVPYSIWKRVRNQTVKVIKSLSDVCKYIFVYIWFINYRQTIQCKSQALGGIPLGILGGGVPPGPPNPDLFQTKQFHFPQAFKVWPPKSIPLSDLASVKLCHQLLRLERQHKDFLQSISNSHVNLFFLFIWNWNDKYVYTLL